MKKRRLTTTAVLATLLTSTVAPSVTQAAKVSEEQQQKEKASDSDKETTNNVEEKTEDQSQDKEKQEDSVNISKEETTDSKSTENNAEEDQKKLTDNKNVDENLASENKAVKEEQATTEKQDVAPTPVAEQAKIDSTSKNDSVASVKEDLVVSQQSDKQPNQAVTSQQSDKQPDQAVTSQQSSNKPSQVEAGVQNNQQNSVQPSQPINNGQNQQSTQSNNQTAKPQPNRPVTQNSSSKPVEQNKTPQSNNRVNSSNNRFNNNQEIASVPTTAADLLPGTPIHVTSTMTGQEFVEAVGEFAAEVAAKNDLYASVMIAQAALETGFGASTLSQEPNYNFFGIKGSYKGESVNMPTQEDSGAGLYTINDNFRKYPSPKESFEDYAELMHQDMYKGVLKSNTKSYQDATKFLTGRYATDHQYNEKLDAIIEAYDLTKYDNFDGSASKQLEKIKKEEAIFYDIKLGDTLSKIALEYETTVEEIQKQNKDKIKNVNLIYSGQKLKVGTKVTYEYKYNSDFSNSDDNNLQAKQGDFTLPLKPNSYTITSPFGDRDGGKHEGVDLATPMNSSVYAARDGKVAAVGFHPSAGNYVIIKHDNNIYTNYFHLSSQAVKVNDNVKAGQLIAKSGNTGNSTGPHLHFGISSNLWSGYANPMKYLHF